MNVYQKLNLAREQFHKSELKKSGRNDFAKYNYFELGDFVVPALAIFKEVGLTSVISFGADTASMKIINNDKPDEVIVVESPMSEANLKGCHPVQNLGAVQTYIRRYLWVAALEIVEHDAIGDAVTGDVLDVSAEILKIQSAKTLDELKDVYTAAYKAAGGDTNAQKMVINAKNSQKAKLEALNGTAN
jgi:hypothetical protein